MNVSSVIQNDVRFLNNIIVNSSRCGRQKWRRASRGKGRRVVFSSRTSRDSRCEVCWPQSWHYGIASPVRSALPGCIIQSVNVAACQYCRWAEAVLRRRKLLAYPFACRRHSVRVDTCCSIAHRLNPHALQTVAEAAGCCADYWVSVTDMAGL